ncbi:hypothetical protein COLO4_35868 [Corchorus olitorius]|uniref:Uncharacterized protein n=1 Tax=Corchorus olitorius TaxID=93759 RepID=A0A1R3GCL4_9ROSI|nr:hypothetical protein COLO4_35868 [Corchorus olitorius]
MSFYSSNPIYPSTEMDSEAYPASFFCFLNVEVANGTNFRLIWDQSVAAT